MLFFNYLTSGDNFSQEKILNQGLAKFNKLFCVNVYIYLEYNTINHHLSVIKETII